MKLKDIIKDIRILDSNADPEMDILGIAYDSRKIQPGYLFVAVSGFQTDGHKFIATAAEHGACAVLCTQKGDWGIPYLITDNSRLALAVAGRNFYHDPASEMKLVGVTGTNGKTTTTHLIKHMLEHYGHKVGLVGTNGNMIGSRHIHTEYTTPESLDLQKLFREMADEGCTAAVMEVSSHSLALDRVGGLQFDAAVYSNLTQDHLDFHGTMEAYAEAKKKLFEVSKVGCFNMDDPWAAFMKDGAACSMLTYSAADPSCDLWADELDFKSSGVTFTAHYRDEAVPARLAIPGMFSVHNALACISAGLSLGLKLDECCAALSTAEGVRGRVESVPTGSDYSIIIDYAHTPDALENVIKTLKPVTSGRLIAVFGCGGDRDRTKRPKMGRIGTDLADISVITSDNPRTEEPEAIIADILPGVREERKDTVVVITDRISAIHWAIDHAQSGDCVLLAGKGHEDYQIIGRTKIHLDEREVVADYLKGKVEKC